MGRKGFNRDIKFLTFISCMLIGMIFAMSEIAYCKGETKTEKETLKKNNAAMKKAEIKNGGKIAALYKGYQSWRKYKQGRNRKRSVLVS